MLAIQDECGNLKVLGKPNNSRLKWVSDLIDPATKTWREDTVRSLFHPADAHEVLRIRIPAVQDEDFIAWAHEKNGLFSVRSAYKLEMELQ